MLLRAFTPGPVSPLSLCGLSNQWNQGIHFYAGDIPTLICVCCLLNPMVKKMRNSKPFATFLDAVNVASISITLFCYNYHGWRTIVIIALLSIVIVFKYKKINSAFVVLGGIIGYLLMLV
jgi:chromate transporter